MNVRTKLLILTIFYFCFATPWYFTFIEDWPLFLGLPLWVIIFLIILISIGYMILLVSILISRDEYKNLKEVDYNE